MTLKSEVERWPQNEGKKQSLVTPLDRERAPDYPVHAGNQGWSLQTERGLENRPHKKRRYEVKAPLVTLNCERVPWFPSARWKLGPTNGKEEKKTLTHLIANVSLTAQCALEIQDGPGQTEVNMDVEVFSKQR